MRKEIKQQRKQFITAIFLLFLFIMVGTCLAEVQMNGLTMESAFSKILNIRYGQDANGSEVTVYVLGECLETSDIDAPLINTDVEYLKREAYEYWQVARIAVKNMNQLVEKYYIEFL